MPLGVGPVLTYAIYWSPLRFIEELLALGADPNQRGLNDWTALHFAVHETNVGAARLLLARGADPSLRTRIDDCETALELARSGGVRKPEEKAALAEIVTLLESA